jgi:FkbH-like protein
MTPSTLTEPLSWLPAAPDDFRQRLQQATAVNELQALSRYALDGGQLEKLARRLAALDGLGAPSDRGFTELTIGLVSNSTTALLPNPLMATGLRHGLKLGVVDTDFNQIANEAFGAQQAFGGRPVDVILMSVDVHGLPATYEPTSPMKAQERLSACVSYLSATAERLHQRTGATVIMQNLVPPANSIQGGIDRAIPGTLQWLIPRLNIELDQLASSRLHIFDLAGLASNLGLANWHDPTLWNIAKLAFSQRYVPIYTDHVCRLLAALRGKNRRCLILDLDNTLWGGVIGDDGLEGIVIGNGNATGEAHLELQRVALALRARGVVLAVCSKNEESVARQPFQRHPDMLLREEHIAVFRANWMDKASNIRLIAANLSLGLDSMVFLDDNPAERLQVRRELPEVAVPELPEDPALFAGTLLAAGYFDVIQLSNEDLGRAADYQNNLQREKVRESTSNMAEYLQSLDMQISFNAFDPIGRSRIAQLINKSNQFNLTTRRYSEAEVERLETDPRFFTLQVRLRDCFGDNGMISVVICQRAGRVWQIDTWLMSCRVLGRSVEEAVLQQLLSAARREGVERLQGVYIPTERNIIVKDHYRQLGFSKCSSDDSATELWTYEIDGKARAPLPMTVTHAV